MSRRICGSTSPLVPRSPPFLDELLRLDFEVLNPVCLELLITTTAPDCDVDVVGVLSAIEQPLQPSSHRLIQALVGYLEDHAELLQGKWELDRRERLAVHARRAAVRAAARGI